MTTPGTASTSDARKRAGECPRDHAGPCFEGRPDLCANILTDAKADATAPECVCPTDNYCPKCHPRWHAKWRAEQCCCESSPPEFGGNLPDRECPIHGERPTAPARPYFVSGNAWGDPVIWAGTLGDPCPQPVAGIDGWRVQRDHPELWAVIVAAVEGGGGRG